MANRDNVDVEPTGHGDWGVKREGAERYSRRYHTQKAAVATATRMAKRSHGELSIHGRDGEIREKSSFGHDPFPPRG